MGILSHLPICVRVKNVNHGFFIKFGICEELTSLYLMKCKEILTVSICSLLLAFLLACLCSTLTGVVIPERLIPDEAKYLDFYYNYVNVDENSGNEVKAPILLIDAHDTKIGSAKGMSQLLPRIYEMGPKAIGLDIIYSDDIEHNKEDLAALKDAFQFCAPKLVMAARSLSDTLQHSFCTKECGLDYGTVNGQSFYSLHIYDQVNDSLKVDKFVVRLARKAGVQIDTSLINSRMINYTSMSFRKIASLNDITPDRVRDKIVLIGDFENKADLVNLPFKVNGKFVIPGIIVNAYQLNALVYPDSMFKKAPLWKVLLFNMIFLFVFTALSYALSEFENKIMDVSSIPRRCWSFIWRLIILMFKPLFMFALLVGIVATCGWWLGSFREFISIVIFAIAEVFLLDSAYKLVRTTYRFFSKDYAKTVTPHIDIPPSSES